MSHHSGTWSSERQCVSASVRRALGLSPAGNRRLMTHPARSRGRAVPVVPSSRPPMPSISASALRESRRLVARVGQTVSALVTMGALERTSEENSDAGTLPRDAARAPSEVVKPAAFFCATAAQCASCRRGSGHLATGATAAARRAARDRHPPRRGRARSLAPRPVERAWRQPVLRPVRLPDHRVAPRRHQRVQAACRSVASTSDGYGGYFPLLPCTSAWRPCWSSPSTCCPRCSTSRTGSWSSRVSRADVDRLVAVGRGAVLPAVAWRDHPRRPLGQGALDVAIAGIVLAAILRLLLVGRWRQRVARLLRLGHPHGCAPPRMPSRAARRRHGAGAGCGGCSYRSHRGRGQCFAPSGGRCCSTRR